MLTWNSGPWADYDATGARIWLRVADIYGAESEIVASVDNAPSQRVAEKVGATREGLQRNRLVNGDRIDDGIMFSLIPADLGILNRKT